MTVMSLRLPDELAERVRVTADRDRRSVNAEIVHMIECCLDQETSLRAALDHLPGFRVRTVMEQITEIGRMRHRGWISDEVAVASISLLQSRELIAAADLEDQAVTG